MSRAFSARNDLWGDVPRALPWAGMNQAFGLKTSVGRAPSGSSAWRQAWGGRHSVLRPEDRSGAGAIRFFGLKKGSEAEVRQVFGLKTRARLV